MGNPERNVFLPWFRAGMEKATKSGKKFIDLANELRANNGNNGYSPSEVTKLMDGTREIKARDIAVIARFIDEPLPRIPGVRFKDSMQLLLKGRVDDSPATRKVSPSVERFEPDQFSFLPHFALKIETLAVHQKIPHGSYAVYVPYFDAREKIIDGDLVYVEIDGDEVVTPLVRKILVNGSSFLLVCASHDQSANEKVIKLDKMLRTKDRRQVTVVGLITYSIIQPTDLGITPRS